MKINSLWLVVIAAALGGCADRPVAVYHQPLTSPGGKFATLPPAVQNSIRAEAGAAEIYDITENGDADAQVYKIRFKNPEVYPPLYVSADGSVLSSNMTVDVGASVDSIAASTGSAVSGIKLDDLPSAVVQTIRHQGPTAEVDSINRVVFQGDIFYDVKFKNPADHPPLLIKDDGRLAK